ncbi:MAG TPA: tetratricopeptide repeat protein, partial [Planctomycetaceae bacterium]|nr:tetratricopeptide repeat protein [Planctomycetaceae bacterium]
HNGTNANRAPVMTQHAATGAHWGNGTGIQMSHGNVNLGYRGSNTASLGVHHANTGNLGVHHANVGNHQFTGNNFHLNNRHVSLGGNHYQPSYYQHNRYHGYWNGNQGYNGVSGHRHTGYGVGPYFGIYGNGYGWGLGYGYGHGYGYRRYGYGYSGYYPFGWGLGGWGLGSIYYSSGYLGYSNPYYYGYGATCYNYAQPIPVAYNNSVTVVQSSPTTAVQGIPSTVDQNSAELVINNAVAAFQQNNFDAALDTIDQGITQYPTDAVLHEFRALVLFAKGDYQQAAATIHSVLAVGPGWDWNTLSSMYTNVAAYTDQLRALEAFIKLHPDDAAGHFLLSYHYLSCGHTEAAARHLKTTVALMPSDKVATDILRMIEAPDAPADPANPPALPPLPVEGAANQDTQTFKPEVAPVDSKTLIGSWKASRPDGSSFVLTLTEDAKFTWGFTHKDQAPQEFGGTYTVDGNVLALERKDGGALIAEITPGDPGKFNFRMFGADESDKGLDFAK